MKRININDRQAVAKAINFGEYPVITIDLADRDEYGLKGSKVRIDNGTFRTGERYFIRATIRVYNDEQVLGTYSSGTCLHADYSYSDVAEMIEWAAAPVIKPDQDVLVMVIDSKARIAYNPRIVHTAKTISAHCIEPLRFEDADMSEFF